MKNLIKFKFCLPVTLAILVFTTQISTSQQTSGQLFEKALYAQDIKGDLTEAIKIYQQILDDNSSDRQVSAKALLNIGMCHEKLGNQEATKTYNRLINNFPDQKNEVAIAKERLSKLFDARSVDEIVIKQIWTGKDVDNLGSPSADGVYLSFTNWSTGNLEIRNLKTGGNQQLTNEGSWKINKQEYAELSLLSPDGKKVVYLWFKETERSGYYELRLIDTDNPIPEILYTGNNETWMKPECWFPDNKKIIFQLYPETNKWQIALIDLMTKEIKILRERIPPPEATRSTPEISLSPDCRYIAYDYPDTSDQGLYDIYLMDIESTNEITLIKHPANDRLIGWLPGREDILFISNRSGTPDIWAVSVPGGKISDPPKRILANFGKINPMGLIRDGSLIYYVNSAISESFVSPLDVKTGIINENQKTILPGIGDICDWLADGHYLVNNKERGLHIYNKNSGQNRNIVPNLRLSIGLPRISPDNKTILVFGSDIKKSKESNKNYYGIYSVDIETGIAVEINVKKAADEFYPYIQNQSVEWDMGGKDIYYVHDHQIIKHNLLTGDEKVIYIDKNEEFRPVLRRSPDGKYLFFNGGNNADQPETQLLSIPRDGGEVKVLCELISGQGAPVLKQFCFSPDGNYIYFADKSGTQSTLNMIPAIGGTPQKIWQSNNYTISGISISPDGKKIALSVFGGSSEIRAIENLGKKVAEVFSENK